MDEIVTRLDSVDIGNAFHDDLGFQDNPNYAQYNGDDESSASNYSQNQDIGGENQKIFALQIVKQRKSLNVIKKRKQGMEQKWC